MVVFQKPIVSAPVLAGPQTVTEASSLLSPDVASLLTVAVLLYVLQVLRTTVTERVYVNVNVFVFAL